MTKKLHHKNVLFLVVDVESIVLGSTGDIVPVCSQTNKVLLVHVTSIRYDKYLQLILTQTVGRH